jgi:hypothetical protein
MTDWVTMMVDMGKQCSRIIVEFDEASHRWCPAHTWRFLHVARVLSGIIIGVSD